jgi:hypothetical protein
MSLKNNFTIMKKMNIILLVMLLIIIVCGAIFFDAFARFKKDFSEEKLMRAKNPYGRIFPEYMNAASLYVKVGQGVDSVEFPGLKISIVDLLEESRCPKGVECAQNGTARILVRAEYKGETVEKELAVDGGFGPLYQNPNEIANSLEIKDLKLFLVAIDPYPTTAKTINKNNYGGLFFVDNVKNIELRNEIARIAKDELKKHVSDYDKYALSLIRMLPNVELINLGYPASAAEIFFNTLDNKSTISPWVKIEFKDGKWQVTDFKEK